MWSLAAALLLPAVSGQYLLDDSVCVSSPLSCRALDGIGGLSGGGATSVLLPFYPEPARSEILDFLFKPNFGASLHLLKVEIGGDAQSTDGSESSHMHNPVEENYKRGYEWDLMVQAKARNPDIKLYGLSWAFPQWVTCDPGTLNNCSTSTNNPYAHVDQLATYITKWVAGAKNTYGLDIDYIGSWNERAYSIPYLKTLRASLDAANFTNTKIIAPDSGWDIAGDILKDADLAAAVHGIGAHYPGMHSSSDAVETGKPLWASEDDSTYNNDVGAGCWARIINRNFVQGNMTSTINWNLLTAYQKGTNWYRAGLFNAMKPWDGNYGSQRHDGSFTVGPMVWVSSHTTQFTKPGWLYLPTRGESPASPATPGFGSGMLAQGGSYVTLGDWTSGGSGGAASDYTIVIEKMSSEHSSCVRPHLPAYATAAETATFQLGGSLRGKVTSLYCWYTHFAYYPGDETVEFQQLASVPVAADGTFTLNITVDSLYTLTTVSGGAKGAPAATPPPPTLFPPTWTDNFNACPISSEAAYFADQNGVWECNLSGDASHGVVMQQMVPIKPVTWGGDIRPHSLIGHRDTFDASMVIEAYITEPGASAMVGVHAQGTDNPSGQLFLMNSDGSWALYGRITDVGAPGKAIVSGTGTPVAPGFWHTYRMDINGSTLNVWVDGLPIIAAFNTTPAGLPTSGHFLIGTANFGDFTQFDNLQLYSTFRKCPGSATPAAGSPVVMSSCLGEVGYHPNTAWAWSAAPGASNGSFSPVAHPELCLTSADADASGTTWLVLAECAAGDARQVWTWDFEGIAPDNERKSQIRNSVGCIDQFSQGSDIGQQLDAFACNQGTNQAFFYDYDELTIGNEWSAVCLGVGPCDE